ncbi:allophanate hydrolase [Pusillimonas minor]|uniref:Allophanate hydrolase n=1 Tax=Pusillimonas minor TaxID=2697024 RepID=A0A842HUR8_9BURK|nr:allophanate hydrolase [Pusillimonas minor]MBC2770545.1 allophanate hydrolase [Pusillimonas minor]
MLLETSRSLITKGWTIDQWQSAYQQSGALPSDLLSELLNSLSDNDPAWISVASADQLAGQLDALARRLADVNGDMSALPLYGVPFAVKDNIDAGGWTTTAACPAFAYTARDDAHVVALLRSAGAVLVGKTNLDQFATGLVGTRSPWGAVPNTFDPAYISGGSSSGSASVVARGLVPFALGTDTAGSGRVPAAFNNIVGLKPTRGWVSNRGLVPACRTLDCITAFALTVEDASAVVSLFSGYDAADPFSRTRPTSAPAHFSCKPVLAVPANPRFDGDNRAQSHFETNLKQLENMGATLVEIDFTPFSELAQLLYAGPWVAERHVAIERLMTEQPEAVHPVVRGIIEQADRYSAADAFRAEYRRAALARQIQQVLATADALVVPSTPSIYTIAQVLQQPVALNSTLGTYTNFTNLADLCALALPGGLRSDGLPAGITLIAPAWHDASLVDFGVRWQAANTTSPGAPGVWQGEWPPAASPDYVSNRGHEVMVAVVGAHLRGMPLNHQLTSRGARFVEETHTTADYRLYALSGTTPPKPGLKHVPGSGAKIALELWAMTPQAFGEFTAEVPAPLGIGNVMLADGRRVKGFICEPSGFDDALDITAHGGWRSYVKHAK